MAQSKHVGYIPSKVLDWSFATRVRSIVASERSEKGSDNCDDLSPVRDMSRGFFENEECGLGVHPTGTFNQSQNLAR